MAAGCEFPSPASAWFKTARGRGRERGVCRRMELFVCHNLCDSGSGVIRTEGSEWLSGPLERESASSLTAAAAEAGPETPGPARVPRQGRALKCWASVSQLLNYRKLVTAPVGVFLPWRSTNTANQGFCFLESWFPSTPLQRRLGDLRRFQGLGNHRECGTLGGGQGGLGQGRGGCASIRNRVPLRGAASNRRPLRGQLGNEELTSLSRDRSSELHSPASWIQLVEEIQPFGQPPGCGTVWRRVGVGLGLTWEGSRPSPLGGFWAEEEQAGWSRVLEHMRGPLKTPEMPVGPLSWNFSISQWVLLICTLWLMRSHLIFFVYDFFPASISLG